MACERRASAANASRSVKLAMPVAMRDAHEAAPMLSRRSAGRAAFFNLLRDNPGFANGVELWSCLVLSINTSDYAPAAGQFTAHSRSWRWPALGPSIATGRTRMMQMPYSEIGELLSRTEFDLATRHTAPSR